MADSLWPSPPPGRLRGHAFISYVREDMRQAHILRRRLEAAGVPVWLDTADLWPGEDWRAKIRQAITEDALVFIACFSERSLARDKSYQNEELNLAIEQLRTRRPEDSRLIPVRFTDCEIPDRDIGGGRMLSSIHRADIFGDREDAETDRLIAVVHRILGRDPEGRREHLGERAPLKVGTGHTTVVEADWALWGKEPGDEGYRVLRCSSGTFSTKDFAKLITRCSPGTLENPPQVTFSWFSNPDISDEAYIAIAIHGISDSDTRGVRTMRYDVAGRSITHVKVFCVRYAALAEKAITYQAMFEGFRDTQLLAGGLDPINTELPVLPVRGVGGWVHELAKHVAALLLTTRPVCVLGADRIGLMDRLWFIDLVMSLLPYGVRSAMSAATWTSMKQHEFRLFFSDVPRESDVAVKWDRPEIMRVDGKDALTRFRE